MRTRSGFLAQMKHVRERMLALKQRDEHAYNARLEKMNPLLREYIVTGVTPPNFGDRFLAGGAAAQHGEHGGSSSSGGAHATASAAHSGGGGPRMDPAARARFEARVKKLFEDTRTRLQGLKAADPAQYSTEVSRLRPLLKKYVETGVLPDFSKFRPRRAHATASGALGSGARGGLADEHGDDADVEDGGRRLLGSVLEEPAPRARQVPATLGLAGIKALFERTRKQMLALKDMDAAAYSVQLSRLRPRLKAFVETGVMPSFGRLEARNGSQGAPLGGGRMQPGFGATARLRSHNPRTSEPHRRLLASDTPSDDSDDFTQGVAALQGAEAPMPTPAETLDIYLSGPGNPVTRLLAQHAPCKAPTKATCEEPEELLRRAKSVLDRVCVIWLEERPRESAAMLAHTLGLPPAELQQASEHLLPDAAFKDELPLELAANVRLVNALDIELYAYAQGRLEQALLERGLAQR